MSQHPIGRARVPGSEPISSAAASPGDPGSPPIGKALRGRKPRKIRWGRFAVVVGVIVGLLIGGVALSGYLLINHYNSKLPRVDAFAGITGNRPPVLVKGAENILLLGSDSRDPSNAADQGGWRTDTIILMHIAADHEHAYLISIPRDTWVYVPRSPTRPQYGDQYSKINSAFSWGGVPLTVETVEQFTGVRIDHAIVINFGGFDKVTDALGGVTMKVDKTITSIHPPYRVFTKGTHHFTGAQALDYIRQREQFAGGDFTRVKHEQQFLEAIMNKATSTGTLTDPAKLSAFLSAFTKAVVVDKSFDLASMAVQFHHIRASDLTFITSPSSGTGTRGGQSVVLSDFTGTANLFGAVSRDDVAHWVAGHPPA